MLKSQASYLGYNPRVNKTTYRYKVDIGNLETVELVIAELEKVQTLLANSELQQVIFFNRAYLIVTKNIQAAIASGSFISSTDMDDLVIAFSIPYFEALNNYARHGLLPGAWRKINRGWLHSYHPSFLSLLLGANAHINHDLPKVLRSIAAKPQGFEEDYFRVGDLLIESSRPILSTYDEQATWMQKIGLVFRRPIMAMILKWRKNVWQELIKNVA